MLSPEPSMARPKASVLLIDDQPMIGEAVRRMLLGENDVDFHYCRDAARAIETADRIARCISTNPLDLGGTEVTLQASIGTATILSGDTVEEVMQRADRNMYIAKTEG